MRSLPLECDLDVVDVETMPVTEKRVHSIESQLGQIAQRVAKLEGHKEGSAAPQKSPNAILTAVLSALGIAVIWYWGWIGTQVVTQGKQISQILTILSPEILKKASAHPDDPQSAKQIEQVVKRAINQQERIDPALVADAGAKFVEASERNPTAWNAALTLVGYRSSLNTYSRTVNFIPVPPPGLVRFEIGPAVPGKPIPAMSNVAGGVAPQDAARFEKIGSDLNEQLPFGAPQLLLRDGAVSLDDKYVRHVLLEGVEIHYSGKPVILEDVVFINCTFVVDNTPQGRKLGQAILASSNVNFQNAA